MIIKVKNAKSLLEARAIAETKSKEPLQYICTEGFRPNAIYTFGDFDTTLAEALREDARYTKEN